MLAEAPFRWDIQTNDRVAVEIGEKVASDRDMTIAFHLDVYAISLCSYHEGFRRKESWVIYFGNMDLL